MITPFLIWFSGFIAAAILFYGNDEFLQEECGIKIKGNTLPRTIAASLGSWFVVLLIIGIMCKERSIFWKFPTGKHYVELQKPILSVLLFLSGFGTVMLVHGVNTHCILMNLSMVIIVLISFFAALHPIKSQKDFFWAVFAMLFPMILDKVLHCLI